MKSLKPGDILNPLNDYLFLKVMGEKGDEVQLLGFLNAVLGKSGKGQLVSVEILDNNRCTGNTLYRYGKMEKAGKERHSE
jgi:hypothetical protein